MKIDKRNFDLKPLGYILFILSCIAWILIVLYREIQKYFCYLLSNYYLFVADLYKIRYIRKQFIKTYLVERVFINYYLATIFSNKNEGKYNEGRIQWKLKKYY
jgi:hypothetical protein